MGSLDDFRERRKTQNGGEVVCEDENFEAEFPGLYSWLARTLIKGETRAVATLTIKYRDGGVNLCLSAPAEGVVGWHQGSSVQNALEGLESRLQASTVDWRERRPDRR